ncbi:MAG: hypothetical protein NTZ39_03115 [Methanoregula sp.]|nr:hypothetical protein [Methanoregula sp.]
MSVAKCIPLCVAGILLITCMTPPVSAWSNQIFAPFVDVGSYPTLALDNISDTTGVQFFTLAFIIADQSGNPSWDGVIPVGDRPYLNEVNRIRAKGGNVLVSFGGASGTELAVVVPDATTLQARYQSVIDTYNATWIDFDIEGGACADLLSIDRRNKAIAGLEVVNPNLRVSYTLPVETDGLTENGLNILRNAKANGARVDIVNVMTMDFGSYYAPDPEGRMGEYAIQSAESLKGQLLALYPDKSAGSIYAMIGITPMIGQNDVKAEVFRLIDAEKILEYARSKGIGFIAMWSLGRDNGSGGNNPWASPTFSGIVQEPFAFSRIFGNFALSQPVVTPTPVITVTPVVTPNPAPTVIPTVTPSPVPTQTVTPPEWSADTIYLRGDQVMYHLSCYIAQWWTKNDVPGKSMVWKLVGSGIPVPTAWEPAVAYTAGEQVIWNGSVYDAKWWTQGDVPGTASVWKLVSTGIATPTPTPTSPVPTPTITVTLTVTPTAILTPTITSSPVPTQPGTPAEWSTDTVYLGGDQVMYHGSGYTAQWWTKNDVPGKSTVWKVVVTGVPIPTAWEPAVAYIAGEQVIWNGSVYDAKWWTQGDVPGSASVWKLVTGR